MSARAHRAVPLQGRRDSYTFARCRSTVSTWQNLRGEFNVPYGRKTHLDPCRLHRLQHVSECLTGRRLLTSDFEDVVNTAQAGDLVYFDPPYTVAHGNNGFIKYNAKIFSWEDQIRLAGVAHRLKRARVNVVVSNAEHPSIRKLYSDFNLRIVERYSVMAASSEFRRPVHEYVFFS